MATKPKKTAPAGDADDLLGGPAPGADGGADDLLGGDAAKPKAAKPKAAKAADKPATKAAKPAADKPKADKPAKAEKAPKAAKADATGKARGVRGSGKFYIDADELASLQKKVAGLKKPTTTKEMATKFEVPTWKARSAAAELAKGGKGSMAKVGSTLTYTP